jgi:hypothetical protein
MIKQNVREETIKAKNNLLLAEIDQYHAVIKDFSNQSASIKKLSITIYISFLSLYYGVDFVDMSNRIFLIIGLAISLFCYVYEIYVDVVRQKMRIKMQDIIISYEATNGIKSKRKKGLLVYKILFIKIFVNRCGTRLYTRKIPECVDKEVYYVNFLHSMYIIYLFEIVATVLVGVVKL